MRKSFIISTLLVMLILTPCIAQKSTIDPNASRPEAPPVAKELNRYDPARDPDNRMAKKISYDIDHARLSLVLSDLSQASGVTIMCGRSKNDWRTRDVPITIYAKALPLGLLLRAIARTTHNILRTERAGSEIIYRICQDARLTRQFEEYEKAQKSYEQAIAAWSWDTLTNLRNVPDSECKPHTDDPVEGTARTNTVRKLAALLSALGPDYRQRALAGETIMLSPSTAPAAIKAPLLDTLQGFDRESLAMEARANYQSGRGIGSTRAPLSTEELEKVKLAIRTCDYPRTGMGVYAGYPISADLPLWPYCSFAVKHPALFEKSPKPEPPRIADESPYDLDFKSLGGLVPDELQVKIDLDDLDAKGLKYPALIKEAAKRAGFSVVVEDFDHYKEMPDYFGYYLKQGTQLQDVYYCSAARFWLRTDLKNKLIVSVAMDWVDNRVSLAPASIIDTLIWKMDHEGVDLKDMMPALALSDAQWDRWIKGSKDLSVFCRHLWEPRDPLWQFYASLTPLERIVASSVEGLSLGSFDPAVVADLLKRCNKIRERVDLGSQYPREHPSTPDAEGLRDLVLRLRTDESTYSSYYPGMPPAPKGAPAPRGLGKTSSYTLEIIDPVRKPRLEYARSGIIAQLPFYSQRREAELIKAITGSRSRPGPR